MNLATKYRPKLFSDVIGQEQEVQILKNIVTGAWKPNAIMLAGPFGTGKTTLARLLARALLCAQRKQDDPEPCGVCLSCLQMDEDNNPGYIELDAASNGKVEQVRELKDQLEYCGQSRRRILVYDEAHMLSSQGQDALLKILEEGSPGAMFCFATTEAHKVKFTIQSRCVYLRLRLLSADQIRDRLQLIASKENVEAESNAVRLIASYVRGHMRDALVLFEQIMKTGGGKVSEELVRAYLRLDRYKEIYEFLLLKTEAERYTRLETLLCSLAPAELQEMLGQALLDAYKVKLGVGEFSEVDRVWLTRVVDQHGVKVLDRADAVLSLSMEFASINQAQAAFARVFYTPGETMIQAGGMSFVPGKFVKPRAQ